MYTALAAALDLVLWQQFEARASPFPFAHSLLPSHCEADSNRRCAATGGFLPIFFNCLMKNLMPVGVLLAALTFLSAGCSSKSSDTAAVTEKPTDLSAAPGDSTGTVLHAGGGDHGSTGHIYSCPMHPEVRSDKPPAPSAA